MNVLFVGGSPSQPSRTEGLLEYLRVQVQNRAHVQSVTVRDFPAEALLWGDFAHPAIVALQKQVAQANAVVVGTPVYKAAYAGALKCLLDLLPQTALAHKVVLPITSGGTAAHMLAVEYALKPVLSALGARHVLQGVFAVDSQIRRDEQGQYHFDDELRERLDAALDRLWRALGVAPGHDYNLLAERIRSARYSV